MPVFLLPITFSKYTLTYLHLYSQLIYCKLAY